MVFKAVLLVGIAEFERIGRQFCHVPNVNKSFNNWHVIKVMRESDVQLFQSIWKMA